MTTAPNLTQGPIRRQLIALSLPLLAGNIMQQLYNTVDAVIVGRVVGDGAFAAAGVAGSVMNLFLFLISGGCSGVGILLSQLHGAGDDSSFRRDFFLSSLFGALLTVGLTGAALAVLSPLLALLQTPASILGYARDYLRIIFLGFLAAFAFHQGSAVLRAVGNTGAALVFLMISMGGASGTGPGLCGRTGLGDHRGCLGHRLVPGFGRRAVSGLSCCVLSATHVPPGGHGL